MLKVGLNVGTRIAPPNTPETPQTPVQQNATEQTIPRAKPILVDGGPMRSEAMMSSMALRTQLDQQLANQSMPVRDLSILNPESLQHTEQIEHQAALRQDEIQNPRTDLPLGTIIAAPMMQVAAVIALLKQLGDAKAKEEEQDTSSSSKFDSNSIRKLDP